MGRRAGLGRGEEAGSPSWEQIQDFGECCSPPDFAKKPQTLQVPALPPAERKGSGNGGVISNRNLKITAN